MKKIIFGIILLSVAMVLVAGMFNPKMYDIFKEDQNTTSDTNEQKDQTFIEKIVSAILWISVIAFMIVIVWFIIRPYLEKYYIDTSLRRKRKIYTIPEMTEAVIDFLKKFGINYKENIYVAAQRVISPSADVPYAYFVVTTVPIKQDMKNMWEDIEVHKRWIVFVDRTTNECSFDFDINTRSEADEYLEYLVKMGTPAQMKKSTADKILEQKIKEGMGLKMGENMASEKDDRNEAKGN